MTDNWRALACCSLVQPKPTNLPNDQRTRTPSFLPYSRAHPPSLTRAHTHITYKARIHTSYKSTHTHTKHTKHTKHTHKAHKAHTHTKHTPRNLFLVLFGVLSCGLLAGCFFRFLSCLGFVLAPVAWSFSLCLFSRLFSELRWLLRVGWPCVRKESRDAPHLGLLSP